MSKYGIKIRKYSAAILFEAQLGIRDYIPYTKAMINNSLFLYFMLDHGLHIHNKESTRDIICLEFDFGTKKYSDEIKRISSSSVLDEDKKAELLQKIESCKDKYQPMSREQLREHIYVNGISIDYLKRSSASSKEKEKAKEFDRIHYRYLYRTPAKAKIGQAIFINEELYDAAHEWLTMGIYKTKAMKTQNARIVELSAYAPLTTSSIVGLLRGIPVEDILILKDQDSICQAMADIVYADNQNHCSVKTELTNITNTLWDGMGLIESSYMPKDSNGMILLRNHFFKMCGFRTEIQLFFKDWCETHGIDYETFEIVDMFGCSHKAKDIKIITTNNAIKWQKKFTECLAELYRPPSSSMSFSLQKEMGNMSSSSLSQKEIEKLSDSRKAYEYWKYIINQDGSVWGIVKTDHPSKLGSYQQMSYQMVNTLPCSQEDIQDIMQVSIDYINLLKSNDDEFETFLRKNANPVNHYEMLADLYAWNHDFANSRYFRSEKSSIIHKYIDKLKTGKIFIEADNLTLCGNPYALLLYAVNADWEHDPTFETEFDAIQCYTPKYKDGEYLAAFRSPQNSANNICYLHNHVSAQMKRYFKFSENILALNNIHTQIQSRLNGADYDLTKWITYLVTGKLKPVENWNAKYRANPRICQPITKPTLVQ